MKRRQFLTQSAIVVTAPARSRAEDNNYVDYSREAYEDMLAFS